MLRAAICAGLLMAVMASTAEAAPVVVGPGSHPTVAVDADGTGYITWIETTSSADTFHYCKLPAGATRCAARFDYSDANQDVDGGYALLPGGNRVLLVEARGVTPNRVKLLWSSTDGGATFSGPTQIGVFTHGAANIAGSALFAPPGTLGLAQEAIFTLGALSATTAPFQATGTTAGTTSSTAELTPNIAASLGFDGTTLLAALSDFNQLSWSRYTGPVPATIETLNTAGNWSSPAPIGPRSAANLDTAVAAGPAGTFVGYEVDATSGEANFVLSRFTGSGWTSPAVIAPHAFHSYLYEDTGGQLRAVWADANGFRYRFSTGATLSPPETLNNTPGESFGFPRVASNAAGVGWAVYAGSQGALAVPLAATYSGPTKNVTGSGFGGTYRLGVPKSCLTPGQRFRVTLRWKRQRRKGNLFIKVRRTDFYLGTKRLTIDKRAPFVHTFRVLITQRPGSTVTVRARAFIKVRHGRTPKKSIRVKVRVCS